MKEHREALLSVECIYYFDYVDGILGVCICPNSSNGIY